MRKAASQTTGRNVERGRQRRAASPEPANGIEAVHALQRHAGNRAVTQRLRGGVPLEPRLRAEMEARFGESFADVRVHNDTAAHASAAAFEAKAYTVGADVVFSAERYAPYSADGKRLLAHELAHVVQQRRGGAAPTLSPAASHEAGADSAAAQVAAGASSVQVSGATGVGVAREPESDPRRRKKAAVAKAKKPPKAKGKPTSKDKAPSGGAQQAPSTPLGRSVADLPVPRVFAGPEYWLDHTPDVAAMKPAQRYDEANQIQEWIDRQTATTPDVLRMEKVRDELLAGADASLRNAFKDRKPRRSSKRTGAKAQTPADAAAAEAEKPRILRERSSVATTEPGTASREFDEIVSYLQRPGIPAEEKKILQAELLNLVPALEQDLQRSAAKRRLAYVSDTLERASGGDMRNLARLLDHIKNERPGSNYLMQGKKLLLELSDEETTALREWFQFSVLGQWSNALQDTQRLTEEGEHALQQYRQIRFSRGFRSQEQMYLWLQNAEENLEDLERAQARWNGLLSSLAYHAKRTGKGVVRGAIGVVKEPFRQLHDLALISGHLAFGVDVSDEDLISGVAQASRAGESRGKIFLAAVPETAPFVAIHDMAKAAVEQRWDDLAEISGGVLGAHVQAKVVEGVSGRGRGSGKSGGAKAPGFASRWRARVQAPLGETLAKTELTAPKQPSARAQLRASKKAVSAEAAAAKKQTRAQTLQAKAQRAEKTAAKSTARAEQLREAAQKRADTHTRKQAEAQAKQKVSPKAREKLEGQVARAKKAMETAAEKARKAAERVDVTGERAKKAATAAEKARVAADAARKKAATARAKAEALKPAPDPEVMFDPAQEPAFGDAPEAKLPANAEPTVWVRTGKGKNRGTYVAEGEKGFGKGDGIAMPKSQAEAYNFRPHGAAAAPKPITPRVIGGRQVESSGAGGRKGSTFLSATARDPTAVDVTAIRSDLAESRAYDQHQKQGEFGIQRPGGSNVRGADSTTAQVQFDANGKPVSAKIFLNDVTSPTEPKGPKASHAEWGAELERILDPDAPPGERLDFGDPALEAVIREAARKGEVYVRVVRVEYSMSGEGAVRTSPSETWPLKPVRAPVVPPHPTRDRDEDRRR